MKKFKRISLILLNTLLFLPVHSQSLNNRQNELALKLHSLAKNAPPELAYIQTSKDIYETGEDLWFKVYLLDAQYLTPSGLSETLYLQLLNESTKKAVWQEKYEIQNGFADGRVNLESSLPEGDYFLSAYTANSFFNDSTEFYAVRRIKVVTDITSGKDSILKPVPGKANPIQFITFPEGGNLVSGIQSKLAFKAVNNRGEPVDFKGTLFEDNSPLLEFKSMHAGMGCLSFIPDIGKKYTIRLSEPRIDSTFLLPEIYPEGITMQLVGKDNDSISFKVSQSPGLKTDDIYLRVQCRGIVYSILTARLSNELIIKLPVEGMPQGIAEVTLFNSSLVPVAERLVFINLNQKLHIVAELSKEIYQTRGKATLKISVKDEAGEPVEANLGISIFDKLYQNPRDSNNIFAHFFLSTQLKGRIYNPSFYFNSAGKNLNESLDLLMLTQGWRRYVWNEENLNKFTESHQQIISDGIKGEIYYPDRKKKIPKEQTFVMAFSPNKDSIKLFIPCDSAGKFIVSADLLSKWEKDYVYMKPLGSHPSQLAAKTYDPLAPPEFSLHIKLTDPFEIINLKMKTNDISYPLQGVVNDKEVQSDSYVTTNGVIKIKEVTINGQKTNIVRGKYLGSLDSLTKSSADDDYVCVYGVLNCPRHLPGFYIPPSLYPPIPYLEKKPIPGKVYFVIYNYNTPGEYTRRETYFRPKYTEDELLKLNNLSRVKAYYGKREFYQPIYDKEKQDDIIPDYRNTLLWEPEVITDENGEAKLNFFCSDLNTDFVGRIEGVSGEGLLGTGYFKFTVRKLIPTP
jgi:hypothetical protein